MPLIFFTRTRPDFSDFFWVKLSQIVAHVQVPGSANVAAHFRPIAWLVLAGFRRSWLDLNLAVAGFHFRNISKL